MKSTKPTFALVLAADGTVDNQATGAAARTFREACRVKGVELAPKLSFAHSSALTHAEKGRLNWTKEFVALYKRGVLELLAGNQKPL